jgi:hypothetical protein
LTSVGFPDVQDGKMGCYAVQPSPDSFVPSVWGRGGDVTSSDFRKATFNGADGLAVLMFDSTTSDPQGLRQQGIRQAEPGSGRARWPCHRSPRPPATHSLKAVGDTFQIGIARVSTLPGKPMRSLFSGTNLSIMKSPPLY